MPLTRSLTGHVDGPRAQLASLPKARVDIASHIDFGHLESHRAAPHDKAEPNTRRTFPMIISEAHGRLVLNTSITMAFDWPEKPYDSGHRPTLASRPRRDATWTIYARVCRARARHDRRAPRYGRDALMGIIFLVVLVVAGAVGAVLGGVIGISAAFASGNNPATYAVCGLLAGGCLGLLVGLMIVRRALRDYKGSSGRR
jgi:hypothetical protein